MALLVASGTFEGQLDTGNQPVTGVGFQPKAIILYCTGQTSFGGSSDCRLVMGMATSAANEAVITWESDSGVSTSDVTHDSRNDRILLFRGFAGGGIIGEAEFVSFDSDGFTINWIDKQDGTEIHYLAFGGDAVQNASVVQFSKATSTGNDPITGVGFQGNLAFIMGNLATSVGGPNDHSSFMFGCVKSASERWCTNGFSKDNVSTGNTGRSQRNNRAIVQTDEDGTLVAEADFIGFTSDGFTLNYSTADGNASVYYALVLELSAKTKLGTFTQPTVTGNQSVTGVGFTPIVDLLVSHCGPTGVSVLDDNFFHFGASLSSTDRRLMWQSDEDGQSTQDSSRQMVIDAAFKTLQEGTTSNIDGEADFVSQDSDGFTVVWDTEDGVLREILYLSIGQPDFSFSFTADADFTMVLEVSRELSHAKQADADFACALELESDLLCGFQADANFQCELTIAKEFACAFQADADFTCALEVERPLAVNLQADADFLAALGIIELFAINFQADADFQCGIDVTGSFLCSFTADADFLCALQIEKALAINFQADADFVLPGVVFENKALACSFQADGDFTSVLECERTIAHDFQADADFTCVLDQDFSLSFLMQVDADFLIRSEFSLVFAHLLQADADFTVALDGGRCYVSNLVADADFTMAIDRERGFAFAFQADVNQNALLEIDDRMLRSALTADADFTMALTLVESLFRVDDQADADFTVALEVEKELILAFQADADFTALLVRERSIDFAFQADANHAAVLTLEVSEFSISMQGDANFTCELEVEKELAFAFQANADFDQALDGGRDVVMAFQADADFTQAILVERGMDIDVQVDADFDQDLDVVKAPFAVSFVAEANFQATVTHELAFAVDFQADANFEENFVQSERLIFSPFEADGNFSAQFDRQPTFDVDVGILANFQINPLEIDLSKRLNFVVDANFDITAILNELALAVSLTADADFLMEFETDRIPGVRVFVVPSTPRGFVVPENFALV